jgi:uncharacterized membrane protein YeaQ/YmgE (transglycosylase-associated protein family)
MTGTMLVTAILVGLGAGAVARTMASDGGRGVVGDLLLGVSGSCAASLMFWAFGGGPETSVSAMAATASVGSAGAIFAQRYLWPAPLRRTSRVAPRPRS